MITLFNTSKVTLWDKIRESFRMRRYLKRFNRDKALRDTIWHDINQERLSASEAINALIAERRKEEYGSI